MLYFIGLGLADETDITVKGLEIVRKAERVYLEAYTSILLVKHEKLVKKNPVLGSTDNADLGYAVASILWSPSHTRRP